MYFLLLFILIFCFGLNSYPLNFNTPPFKSCNTEFVKSFVWQEKYFQTEASFLKDLETHAKLLARNRINQLHCLKKISQETTTKNVLLYELENKRQLELELLEYGNNFFHTLEKKYLFEKLESQALEKYLITKSRIYENIYQQSLQFLDEEKEAWIFQNLYLSLLWNQYSFFNSLRKEIRKKVLTEIN